MRATLRRLAVVTGAAVLALAATVVPAAAAPVRPAISSVVFAGVSGDGVASPTITVRGTGFGGNPPAGFDNSENFCGIFTGTGNTYGRAFYFRASGRFEAGYDDPNGKNCIGIVVTSWGPAKIVFTFGSAYGTSSNESLVNGGGYAIAIRNGIYGGAVSGLTPAV